MVKVPHLIAMCTQCSASIQLHSRYKFQSAVSRSHNQQADGNSIETDFTRFYLSIFTSKFAAEFARTAAILHQNALRTGAQSDIQCF